MSQSQGAEAPDPRRVRLSKIFSRFGIRALSVVLLLVAVIGGFVLTRDRDAPQRDDTAVTAAGASGDERQLGDRAASRAGATSRQRVAEREAAEKAADAAKAAAQRARRVDDAATRKKEEEKKAGGTVPFNGPIPASCNEYSGNRAIGCALMLEKGFGLDQMPCLEKLWTRESGWNHRAQNNSSGAYGIPQALPGSKMASAGADWENNPATQIKWGLGYIKGRYDTPCGAWQYFQNNGSY